MIDSCQLARYLRSVHSFLYFTPYRLCVASYVYSFRLRVFTLTIGLLAYFLYLVRLVVCVATVASVSTTLCYQSSLYTEWKPLLCRNRVIITDVVRSGGPTTAGIRWTVEYVMQDNTVIYVIITAVVLLFHVIFFHEVWVNY